MTRIDSIDSIIFRGNYNFLRTKDMEFVTYFDPTENITLVSSNGFINSFIQPQLSSRLQITDAPMLTNFNTLMKSQGYTNYNESLVILEHNLITIYKFLILS